MQLYKGRKTVSSDQITRYKAHICQRNTGGKKKKKKQHLLWCIYNKSDLPKQTPQHHFTAEMWLCSQMPACKCLSLHAAKENLTSRSWKSGLLPDGKLHAPSLSSTVLLHIKSLFSSRNMQRAVTERDILSLLNRTMLKLHLSERMIMCSCQPVIQDGHTRAGTVLNLLHFITVQRMVQLRGIFTWPTLGEVQPLIKV